MPSSPEPMVLLLHDGELADVRATLDEIGALYVEWIGRATQAYEQSSWDLVIASSSRMLNLECGAVGKTPTRIAVLEKDSRTLRATLRRIGVDFMVGRPVHPVALRLLVHRVLYRGPEKRRSSRVSVGIPVQFRTRLRRKPAILADLSDTGCLLRSNFKATRGGTLTVFFPPLLGDGKAFSVKGEVRRAAAIRGAGGSQTISMQFRELSGAAARRIRKAVSLYAEGPAVLDRSLVETLQPIEASARPQALPEFELEPQSDEESAAQPEAAAPGYRRRGERLPFSRRVIALGNTSARVLIGRDLSLSGMRVEPHSDLQVGEEIRIALHARVGREPLVLCARVERGDQETGFGLSFQNLNVPATGYLTEMLSDLPSIEGLDAGGAHLVVSELIPIDGKPATE